MLRLTLAIAPSSGPHVLRFGVFEVDLHSCELRKNGVRVRLPEQPFQLLTILLEHPGEMVTREDLQKRLWSDGTFVDFEQGLNAVVKRLREALEDPAEAPGLIETLPRRGYRFIGHLATSRRQIASLAVLPLENLSHDPEQEYFADGLTEALITSLAKIGALRVVSRTTVMHYKGVHRPLSEIAQELRVGGIVEGTVLRSGDRVRISAQLLDAHTDTHLWAESYDRELREVLTLQSEVAQAIAREVRVKLTSQEHEHVARARPVDPGAYEAYLKGRHYWNKRTAEALKKGAQYFQEAIDKDPTYAPAYAGVSDCSGSAGFRGFASPDEGCGRAKTAARKALEIDETAEARASLAWAVMHYDFDFFAAEKECQRAIELNPRYATAHQWYGHCLVYMGQLEHGREETQRALQLDPLSLIINASHAGALWFERRWDKAIEHCLKALELDPSFAMLRWILAHAYQSKGMHDQAICERKRVVELSNGAPLFVAELASSYARAGLRDEALQILEQLHELSKRSYVMAYWMVLIHAGLKQKEEAFHWLETARQERSAMLAWVGVDPRLDYLRSDPRFQDLLRRMNFPL
jgi:TolB-like protein/Flp pilus assembly protein TadD